jgi:hypothetical protein
VRALERRGEEGRGGREIKGNHSTYLEEHF